MLVIYVDGQQVRPDIQYSSVAELKELLKEEFKCKDMMLTCNGSELNDQNKWSMIGPSFSNIVVTGIPLY